MSRSGMVALVGRPNVGKSTLMNSLVGEKVSIITPMAQTTRNQIRGIQNHEKGQVVYLDTPGIHRARKQLNRYMVDVAFQALEGVDVIFYLIDATRPDPAIHKLPTTGKLPRQVENEEDSFILERLRKLNKPTFLVINKIDLIKHKEVLLPLIESYSAQANFKEVVPISATEEEGLDLLCERTFECLPEAPPLFPPEYSTDQAERFLVSEMVREKVILLTRKEIPHSCAVVVEEFDESEREFEREDRGLVRIQATVFVERDSQKGILIGKRGAMLKEIGSQARKDIEGLLGSKVYLKLWVKVAKNWSKDQRALRRMGYS